MEREKIELLWGQKATHLYERIFSFRSRFPRLFPEALFKEMGPFFSACTEDFLESRDLLTLCQILFARYRVIQKATKTPNQRIHLQITPLEPCTFGITIALVSLGEQELFSERHIQKGVQSLIPGIKPIVQSYFSGTRGKVHLYYLEIKKVRGGIFTKEERNRLTFDLPCELLQSIELVSQSLFLPGNEEELFKNIRHLAREIRHSNDLPQVMISFIEYINETLKFLVIVLRVIKPNTPTLLSQSALLPSLVRFSLENLFCLEKLRKKYPKEAAIFTLEVSSSLFLRNKNSVNLRAARQYIAKALENMLGQFRDYNGGLLIQENRQLYDIKQMLEKKGVDFQALEEFFYAIKPISLRATFSTQAGSQFIEMIQKMALCPLGSKQKYRLECHIAQKTHLVVIQTNERSWKTSLPKKILAKSSHIGYSCFEDENYLYLCFFHQSAQNGLMLDSIQKELAKLCQVSIDPRHALLRINFQGGDPSSLNPRLAADIHSHILANLLFEGLMRFTDEGEVVAAVAEKVTLSESQTEYTFHIRPAWWSSGEVVTAYHFEKTWKKALLSPNAACMKPEFFSPIKNAKKAREKKVDLSSVGIRAQNPNTLFVELEAPCSYFLNLLATPSFFPLCGDSEEPSIFNGPFTLAEWRDDQEITLSQNPFYWNSHNIKLGGIHISRVVDSEEAYQMFRKGSLDLIGDPICPLSPKILNQHEIKKALVYKEISRVFWIHCNLQSPPLNNVNLRKALSLALNRKQLVERVFLDQIPSCSPLPHKYSHFLGPLEGDLDLAQKLFKKALDEMEMGMEDFPTLHLIHSYLSFEAPLAEELKAQWKEALGISLCSRALPWSEFSSTLEKGDFQLGGLFRRDLFNNPMFYLNFFKKSNGNIHSWDNQEYEALLDQLQNGNDLQKNIKKIEHLLVEHAPVIPLATQRNLMLINDRIEGLKWMSDGCLDLREVRINHEANVKDIHTHFPDYSNGVSGE